MGVKCVCGNGYVIRKSKKEKSETFYFSCGSNAKVFLNNKLERKIERVVGIKCMSIAHNIQKEKRKKKRKGKR